MTKYYWGRVDALINWCEHDYTTEESMIAEFYNTWSNLFFILSGLLAIRLSMKFRLPITYIITAYCIVLTGVFSFCFHASLRWWMQKLDESFETLLLLGIFHSFESEIGWMYTHMIVAVVGILFIEKWFCEIHLILIAVLSFIQLYQLGYKVFNTFDVNLYYKLFGRIRNYFLIAGITWLIDRIACEYLYNLPYNLPNPQLHAFGWHLFCALGLNQTMIVLIIIHKLEKYKPSTDIVKKSKYDLVNIKSFLYFIDYDIDFNFIETQKEK